MLGNTAGMDADLTALANLADILRYIGENEESLAMDMCSSLSGSGFLSLGSDLRKGPET